MFTCKCFGAVFLLFCLLNAYAFFQFSLSLFLPLADSDVLQQLSSVSLGDKLKLSVDVTREDGSVILTTDQLSHATVLASKYHVTGTWRHYTLCVIYCGLKHFTLLTLPLWIVIDVNTTAGNQVAAVVLHVDFSTSEVHVSLLPKLKAKKKRVSRTTKEAVNYSLRNR